MGSPVRFDAVVVGSGIDAMVAGALLAALSKERSGVLGVVARAPEA